MDVQTIGIVVAVVAVVVFVLYIWDRRTKQQEIDVGDATKLSIGASALAGGVAYAMGGSEDVMESVKIAQEAVQDMFLGKPDF
jgi:uncharacterized membrane protein YsdA (DUF1294 family)